MIKLNMATKVVLFIILTTGALTIAVTIPNALRIYPFIKSFYGQKISKTQKQYRLNKTAKRLESAGYIKRSGNKFFITKKGEMLILKVSPSFIKEKNKKWDKKWRIVCFDVKEDSRKKRDSLRKELKNIGFIQMQKSVWVCPYPCEGYIELLKTDFGFGKNIRYMIATKISDDEKIRAHFKI